MIKRKFSLFKETIAGLLADPDCSNRRRSESLIFWLLKGVNSIDYGYDVNGNLVSDVNKKIGAANIAYYILNSHILLHTRGK